MAPRLAVAFAAFALLATPTLAAEVAYDAPMSGQNESPPNDSPASGRAAMRFNTDTRVLSWRIEYENLTGPSIGAHIHGSAAPGTNAGVLLPLASAASPIEGSATLTEAQAKALEEGKLYVNIHTQKHPGGELRGQIVRE